MTGPLPRRRRTPAGSKTPGREQARRLQRLRRQLLRDGSPSQRWLEPALLQSPRLSGAALWYVILCAALLLGLLLAGLLGRLPVLFLLAAPVFLLLLLLVRRQAPQVCEVPDLLSMSDIHAVDEELVRVMPILPATAQAKVDALLAQLIPLLQTMQDSELPCLSADDRGFLRQLLLRYLPDAMQYFADLWQTPGLSEDSRQHALEEFDQQIDALQTRLGAIQSAVADARAERLDTHGRFLRNKRDV